MGGSAITADHHRRRHDECRGQHRRGAESPDRTDTPGRKQRERKPYEVDARREHIVAHQHDAERVEQL